MFCRKKNGSARHGHLTIIWHESRKRLAAIAGSLGDDPRTEHARGRLSAVAPHGKSQERNEILSAKAMFMSGQEGKAELKGRLSADAEFQSDGKFPGRPHKERGRKKGKFAAEALRRKPRDELREKASRAQCTTWHELECELVSKRNRCRKRVQRLA